VGVWSWSRPYAAVAVPDGTICNLVLPVQDREHIDDIATSKNTTRSALLSEVLGRVRGGTRNLSRNLLRVGALGLG
jgi:hypothetical protein